MGDGVNIAARLEGIAEPGGVCLSEDAYRQVREKLSHEFVDLGETALKNIARPIGVYAVKPGVGYRAARTPLSRRRISRSWPCPSPTCPATRNRSILSMA